MSGAHTLKPHSLERARDLANVVMDPYGRKLLPGTLSLHVIMAKLICDLRIFADVFHVDWDKAVKDGNKFYDQSQLGRN